MSTLLLRLSGPLQSWGVNLKDENNRITEQIPTKSGVIGLLAAALGRRREESIEDLSSLRFGVRVDRVGELHREPQTANVHNQRHTPTRHYLKDAVFLAGVEGDEVLLEQIECALRHPVFPLSLGRSSYHPEGRLSLGIRRGKSLYDALCEEAWQLDSWRRSKESYNISLRIVMDARNENEHSYYQRDVPISFNPANRKFGTRSVHEAPPIVIENPDSHEFVEIGHGSCYNDFSA